MRRVIGAIVAVTFAVLMGGWGNGGHQKYRTTGIEILVKSAVRVQVLCDGTVTVLGSGSAIAPKLVITARHVVDATCGPKQAQTYRLLVWDGTLVNVAVDKVSGTVDAARLVVKDEYVFGTYGQLTADEPIIGEEVCTMSGGRPDYDDGFWEEPFMLKCGYVTRFGKPIQGGSKVKTADGIVTSVPTRRGNSGTGVFNARGQIVGLVTHAEVNSNAEPWSRGPSAVQFRDLWPDRE